MNLVKRELKANMKSILIWSVSMAFLMNVWMIEYEPFAKNPAINDFMAVMPQEMLAVLGMKEFSLASLNGFIGSISLYLYLLLGIQAVLLGSSIIAKEERDRTEEYMFSLPVSRGKILVGKEISSIINIILLNLVTLVSLLFSTLKCDKGNDFYRFIGITFIALFIIQIIFLSIGMFVAALNENQKQSGNIAVGILMGTFLILLLIKVVERLYFLRYITPFKYFETAYLMNELALEPICFGLSLVITFIGKTGTFIFYSKRDLELS